MITRMKAHWPERINPRMELRNAYQWLEHDTKEIPKGCTAKPRDIYRVLACVQAMAIIDDILRRWDQIP